MDFGHDIAARVRDAVFGCLVAMQHWGVRCDRGGGLDDRRQDFILNLEPAAAFLGGSFGFGNNGRYLLTDEADNVVEHLCVIRIHPVPLVPRG